MTKLSVCPACGTYIDINVTECPNCHAIFDLEAYCCPTCQAQVQPTDEHCHTCGQEFQTEQDGTSEEVINDTRYSSSHPRTQIPGKTTGSKKQPPNLMETLRLLQTENTKLRARFGREKEKRKGALARLDEVQNHLWEVEGYLRTEEKARRELQTKLTERTELITELKELIKRERSKRRTAEELLKHVLPLIGHSFEEIEESIEAGEMPELPILTASASAEATAPTITASNTDSRPIESEPISTGKLDRSEIKPPERIERVTRVPPLEPFEETPVPSEETASVSRRQTQWIPFEALSFPVHWKGECHWRKISGSER